MIVGGLMLSTIVSKIIIIFDEAHLHEKMMKAKMLQVEQWVKDIKLPKLTRSRVLTFYRRQEERPYDQGALLLQLPFEMRCLVAKVTAPPRRIGDRTRPRSVWDTRGSAPGKPGRSVRCCAATPD